MLSLKNVLEDLKSFENTHILNGAIAVAVGDKMVYSNCSGMADIEGNIPCTIDTQYNIASVTKQFTAAALLRVLFDANPSLGGLKKALQNPLSHYLTPEDLLWDGEVPEWATIVTLHQLLTHTSGIVNYTDLALFWDNLYPTENPSILNLMNLFKKEPLNFDPGTQYEYCNSGYTLLGQVIERLSKKTLGQYFMETFFVPLKMRDTSLPTQGTSLTLKKTKLHSNLARGYTYDIKSPAGPYTEIKNYWPHKIDQGDGGIISTIPSLVKWNTALYKGRVLPPDVLRLMLTPYELIPGESNIYYGYGIVCRESLAGTIVTHGGSIPGYHNYPIYLNSIDTTVISFTNVTFDSSCIQDRKQAIKDELADVKDTVEKEEKYNEIFAQRYPEIVKIKEEHRLFQVKDIKALGSDFPAE
jgi:CubicO group peptidase (beta-lactamase class C family)